MMAKVRALFRYPVKSLAGETVSELSFNARGAVGDRRFALYDRDGKIGSGKSTRRFNRIEGLLFCQHC